MIYFGGLKYFLALFFCSFQSHLDQDRTERGGGGETKKKRKGTVILYPATKGWNLNKIIFCIPYDKPSTRQGKRGGEGKEEKRPPRTLSAVSILLSQRSTDRIGRLCPDLRPSEKGGKRKGEREGEKDQETRYRHVQLCPISSVSLARAT